MSRSDSKVFSILKDCFLTLPFLTKYEPACKQAFMDGPKVVKRYANRKLYDTERSCYVTLDDIAVMVRGGEDVKVIDNKSGEDLTSVTLAQIIFEAEKKNHFLSINLLKGLIQNSGDVLTDFARGQVETVQTKAQVVQGQVTDLTGRVKNQWDEKVLRSADETRVKELVSTTQKAIDEFQRGFEERIQDRVDLVSQNVTRELEDMRRRLGELREKMRK